jgi:membrane protein
MSNSLSATAKEYFARACALPVVGVLLRAALEGKRDFAKDMAASIAYYTFLSLFPLMLGLLSIGGYFLGSEEVQAKLHDFLVNALPVSADFVAGNIETLVRARGAAGLTSVVVLFWSASKLVAALSRGINNALGMKSDHAFYLSHLRNFGLTLGVAILIFSAIALAPAAGILAELKLDIVGTRWNALFDIITGRVVGFAITFIMLAAIYKVVPFERLSWRELLPGIFVATCTIELGKVLFTFYYGTVSNYDLIYGSLTSIIVLLLWLYFCARVVLYGTEVIFVYRQD